MDNLNLNLDVVVYDGNYGLDAIIYDNHGLILQTYIESVFIELCSNICASRRCTLHEISWLKKVIGFSSELGP